MSEFAVLIEFDDDVAWANTFDGNFSGRIGCSVAEDAVADKTCESAAGTLHAHMCSIRVSCGSILFCDVIQCPAYSASPFGVVVPCHARGVLFQ